MQAGQINSANVPFQDLSQASPTVGITQGPIKTLRASSFKCDVIWLHSQNNVLYFTRARRITVGNTRWEEVPK